MLKRILITGLAAVALALVAPMIGAGANVAQAGEDCAGGSSAHASGEDCPPAQPAPQPQPAPKPEAPKEESGGGSGSAGGSESTPATPQAVRTQTPVSAGVDTGTIPQGGIQAGAGGTAGNGSMTGLLWGGALILVVAAGGLARRRRGALAS
jgi:hypothetical protein